MAAHPRALYERAGFAHTGHTGHTEIVYLARVDELSRPARPPIAGLSVRRSAGMNGTRLSAVLSDDVIGYIEVEALDEGERLSRHGGWADIGNLRVTGQYRRRGVATWLLGQAADWLQLAQVKRLLDYAWLDGRDPMGCDYADYRAFLLAAGFRELTRNQIGWSRAVHQPDGPAADSGRMMMRDRGGAMHVTVLAVPGCVHLPVLEERLTEALGGLPGVSISRQVIATEDEAARSGMHGSPTILIDGLDPFAAPGQPASLSCRLYRDSGGQTVGAPSVSQLRRALTTAANGDCAASPIWLDALGRADRGRISPAERGLRAVHQAILRSFAATGRAPEPASLEEAAAPFNAAAALAELAAGDFLFLDQSGRITAAYPFSAAATPHKVQIAGGGGAYAMCAIDALGMAAMLGTSVLISSADPVTAEPIAVTVDGSGSDWRPATAVVFVGRTADQCAGPSAETCCSYINFFASRPVAAAWARAHPEIDGGILSQARALEVGEQIFGQLLR